MEKGKTKTRADGRVEICRTINGKVRHFYGKTKREAEEKYRAALVKCAERDELGARFEEVATEWWASYLKKIKPGTERGYKGGYQNVLEYFTGYRMKEITPAIVNTWSIGLQSQSYAKHTAQNARSVLSLIFKFWCVRDGDTYNPVPLVQLPKGMAETERLPPTPEQVALVKEHPEGFGLCAWLFMYTGGRLGEIMALQWQDIDFDEKTIRIYKSVTWINSRPIIQVPKTKNSIRTIPLLSPLRTVLLNRKGDPDEYVLGGKEPLKSYQYRRMWLKYCIGLGMIEIDSLAEAARDRKYMRAYGGERKRNPPKTHLYKAAVTAHQFRHEFASVMYEAGIGELEAQKIMGHADIATTRKIYTHIRETQIKDAGEKLERFLRGNTHE